MISALDTTDVIITDISETPRPRTSLELTDDLRDMFLDEDVERWGEIEDAMSIPSVEMGWCGVISTVASLVLPDDLVITIAEKATAAIAG